ncbi:MAG: hypothetical protein D6795_06160 [Deltaproteobacteria bacterium]|nr:MAG: hypothetical protein D6795_06160 [Deltaproteobacteria bacterium]
MYRKWCGGAPPSRIGEATHPSEHPAPEALPVSIDMEEEREDLAFFEQGRARYPTRSVQDRAMETGRNFGVWGQMDE